MIGYLKRLLFRAALKVWSGPWYPDIYCMIHSVYLPRALYVAAALGIADHLKRRPRTVTELAEVTGAHGPSLYRILRLLAAYDVFAEDRNGFFRLARLGKTLTSDHPESSRWWTLSLGEELWESNSRILEAVKTGTTGFELAHGKHVWQWYPDHPREHDIFIKGMNGFTRAHCREIVRAFDFRRFGTLVDVGGGGGVLMSEILRSAPDATGIVFDQPRTIEETRTRIEEVGLSARCQAMGGNFFDGLPKGADAYILKHVLRDWDDDSVKRILVNCHEAMPEDGALLVVDAVVDPANNADRLLKLIDVQMMIDAGGGLRTRTDFERLFAETGFQLVKTHRTMIIDGQIMEARRITRPTKVLPQPVPASQMEPEPQRSPVVPAGTVSSSNG